jgi:hypothetical protein
VIEVFFILENFSNEIRRSWKWQEKWM